MSRRYILRVLFSLVLVKALPVAIAQTEGMTVIADGTRVSPNAINASGTVVVGDADTGSTTAFRWTEAGGMQSLGTINGGTESFAFGVSGDGMVIVGRARDGAAGNADRAFRWTQSTGMVSLGILPGGTTSSAAATNADGTVIVGTADEPRFVLLRGTTMMANTAFRWTQAGGMESLGVNKTSTLYPVTSSATGVSADGNVVVGYSGDIGSPTTAFRWTRADGMVDLGVLSGGRNSYAYAVSADGLVVVGQSEMVGDGPALPCLPVISCFYNRPQRAFRWTTAEGMVSLHTLNGGYYSSARAVNRDGSVIVGRAQDGPGGNYRGFRWTQATGLQSVETWLRQNGVKVPSDSTNTATGVSSYGDVVTGLLDNSLGFIARVSPMGSGLITMESISTSLGGNSSAPGQVASLGGIALNGAHSRPLAKRVAPGASCVWTSGDVGRDDHGIRNGSFGLAEIGGCYNSLSNVQASLSIGRSWSNQYLVFNGKSDARTTYGIAELLGNVGGNVWASGAVLLQRGSIDALRGYSNAGAQDFSQGRPGISTTALRLRLDWEDAVRFREVDITPYIDVSHARHRIDGYTETGGGFPVRFDARMEKDTEFRLGADAAYPLSSATKLIGRLEAAHRLESAGASSSGSVLGLFDFNLAGQQLKQDWLRLGAGVESRISWGIISANLNATSQSAVPNYWFNVSYQLAF